MRISLWSVLASFLPVYPGIAFAEVPSLAEVDAVVPTLLTVNAPKDPRCRFVNEVLQAQLERVLSEGGLKILPPSDVDTAPTFTMLMVADLPNPTIPSTEDRCLVTAEAALTVPVEPPVVGAVVELWTAAPVLGEVLAGNDPKTPSADLADQARRFIDGYIEYFLQQRASSKAP